MVSLFKYTGTWHWLKIPSLSLFQIIPSLIFSLTERNICSWNDNPDCASCSSRLTFLFDRCMSMTWLKIFRTMSLCWIFRICVDWLACGHVRMIKWQVACWTCLALLQSNRHCICGWSTCVKFPVLHVPLFTPHVRTLSEVSSCPLSSSEPGTLHLSVELSLNSLLSINFILVG